jgi:hypothetical protein
VISSARLIACGALVVLAVLTAPISALAAVIAASLVPVAAAVADTRASEPSTATL